MMSMASNLPFPPDPAAAFALRGRLLAAAALTAFLVGGSASGRSPRASTPP